MAARQRGVTVGKATHLSTSGQYVITDKSQVTLAEGVMIGAGYIVRAHHGSVIQIGRNVHFGPRLTLIAGHGAHITIGEDCSFNSDVTIVALDSITIGRKSIFGPSIYISDHNHRIERSFPIGDQGYDTAPLEIGSDVWLGVGATLLKGSKVNDGAVVAARSVVTKEVPEYEIWAGIPAKKIGERP